MDPEDEEFNSLYLQWLQHAKFTTTYAEEWERMLRSKNEKPAERCRHGNAPLRCTKCYFHGPESND